ncbi:hypothetical protein HBI29_166040 [Parastagonospora nodorum]|nr:hypothetical protein HBH49_175320 [Parastagonospora nodorum]KAH4063057.1 hypothetical protein HBH50_198970 [Parastagonospora nodorum]KAH4083491.1 hypothetical protein HBH48_175870 [Parastagonospora nodorum]KAH5498828.1 hypothetical protein HBI29_166040 [Parastagonospora nodorum]KAH5595276.1 hypothetical protein HBI45_187520 [Parastagonospora nodorum]
MTHSTQSAVATVPKETTPTVEASVTQTMPVETDIDIDLSDSPANDTMIAAPAAEYQEDLIDYDDDELLPASHDSGDDTLIGLDDTDIKFEDEITVAKDTSLAEQQADHAQGMQEVAEHHLEQAKYMMSMGPQTLLGSSPDMASALQLNNVGDNVTVNVSVDGITYEITWKVAAVHGEQPQPAIEQPAASIAVNTTQRKTSLRDAPPLSTSANPAARSAVKCKFGSKCNKGTSCTFEHTVKVKLCTWVNTAQGCTKGKACEFSHDNEGAKCTRSTTRSDCANGKGCAFKHGDDVGIAVKPKAVAPAAEQVKTLPPADAPIGPKVANAPPSNAPTGPKGTGKRSRDQDDDGGNETQHKRVNNSTDNFKAGGSNNRGVKQYRGRGRGNARAGGRERVGGALGGDMRIKDAAGGR